jgi:hypothetical protein
VILRFEALPLQTYVNVATGLYIQRSLIKNSPICTNNDVGILNPHLALQGLDMIITVHGNCPIFNFIGGDPISLAKASDGKTQK